MDRILKVTFDSNVLRRVLRPDTYPLAGAPDIHDQQIVHQALQRGIIEGFVAQTFFTKEALAQTIREDTLRGTFRRFKKPSSSLIDPSCIKSARSAVSINKMSKNKNWLDWEDVLSLMRQYHVQILKTRLLGDIRPTPQGKDGDFRTGNICEADYYQCNSDEDAVTIRNNECFEYILKTLHAGVLSVDYLDAMDGKLPQDEASRVLKFDNPSAEEADVQAIAIHYAHQLDVFCTEDLGKSAGGNSVMKAENKEALRKKFGIHFCTLKEVANEVVAIESKLKEEK